VNILFISISSAVAEINNRGIYPDLLRKFASEGHNIFIVCPSERRQKVKTNLKEKDNINTLMVQTLNITKTNIIEKGISTVFIDIFFKRAIRKYFWDTKFDLILYATPPITFNGLIKKLKIKNKAATYLLLKDIFPQNAIDIQMLSIWNPLYYFFRAKEISLYNISDYIGCMSAANVKYVLKNNPNVSSEKLEVCPNSIELINDYAETNKHEIRKKYGIPLNKTVCIYGGNLGKPQGIDFLVEVLRDNKYNKDLFFVVAGSGTETYKLKQFVQYECPKNMIFLPQMARNDFDDLLSASDIGMIFLDKRYTIPNYPSRLLNYLEFKKPVLMATDENTDIGYIAEENEYGLWVKSGDLESFNFKLNYLTNNIDKIKSFGENGYRYLQENYTVNKSYEIIMSHFK
jgi:glycosyltransferase involved in cell wall biosynthesis